MNKERVQRVIERCQKQIDRLEGLELSIHGERSLWYEKGRMSELENLLDYLEEQNDG